MILNTFNGFNAYDYGDDIPLTETFPNRLWDFKPEYLTFEDCLFIQDNLYSYYFFDEDFDATAKKLYDYIDNMVQIRIAIEIYGEKTGYKIIKENTN